MLNCQQEGFIKSYKDTGPSELGGGGGGGWAGAPNNCQTVVCFLYNGALNEMENTGQPPNMNFVPTTLGYFKNTERTAQ